MLLSKVTSRQLFVNGVNTIFKRLLNASIINEQFVQVEEGENKPKMTFPGVWLRDNCGCEECFHEPTKSRKVNWESGNVGVRAQSVTTAEQTQTIRIRWNDGHESNFDLSWLKQRDFSAENRARYIEEDYRPVPVLWSKEEFNNIWRKYDYKDIFYKDEVLLSFLETLAKYGVALIENSSNDQRVVRQIADNIGFIKRTTYGEIFEVKSKKDAMNYSYLMTPLPLHTDMPYYEYKAGINILHCFVQSMAPGGSNLLTDGFYVADILKHDYPKYYELLVRTPVDWYDIGKDGVMSFHNIWRAPVICLDVDGNYARINHNVTKRDSHFTVPLEQVIPWYEAYNKFVEIAYAQAVEFKTKSGDVFVFNNLRMLHGRTAYEDSSTNKRHMIGAYVDWDVIYSKMRILKKQL